MRQKIKSLSIVLCVVLILVSTVAGTLAYFTDSEAAVNTFTVGEVGITLTENSTNEPDEDVEVGEKTEDGYEYTLIPGLTYAKEPVVTVIGGSEESYVRMLVTFNKHDELCSIYKVEDLTKTTLLNWNAGPTGNWVLQGVPKRVGDETVYEFRYSVKVAKTDKDLPLAPLFTKVQMPEATTNAQLAALKNLEITVEAHAIQAAGFTDANAAWAAFDEQQK